MIAGPADVADYRVTMKVRNNRLLTAIEKAGLTVPTLCAAIGISEEQLVGGVARNVADFELDRDDVQRPGSSEAPGERLLLAEATAVLDEVLDTLTERERDVLRCRFGIGGEECTLQMIADKFGVGRQRIRQIEEKALRKLRHPSRLELLADAFSIAMPETEPEPETECASSSPAAPADRIPVKQAPSCDSSGWA